MGSVSGKFIVPRVDTKVTEPSDKSNEIVGNVDKSEISVQMLNGAVTTTPDVPNIDGPNEETTDEASKLDNGHVEEVQDSNETSKPNDVSSKEEQNSTGSKTPKKHQNPLVWLKRRISKKSIRKHSAADEQVENEKTTLDSTVEKVEEHEVTSKTVTLVADNLVDEIIQSATSAQIGEKLEDKEASPLVNLGCMPQSCIVSDTMPTVIPEPSNGVCEHTNANEVQVGGGDLCELVDTNNTNVSINDNILTYNTDINTEDVIAAKLANIELANGHHDHSELINDSVHHNGYTNGNAGLLVNGNTDHLDD